jgi:ribonuclease Z
MPGPYCIAVSRLSIECIPLSTKLSVDPCLGYIFREVNAPARKIVILGDTYDPSPIIPLCTAPSLLIHEATDAHIPREINPQYRRAPDLVLRTALARGHSIPQMAGEFAKTIGAEKLVLNHIGGRYVSARCRFSFSSFI